MAYGTISGYSTTRITGLSSGLDTDSLVKVAMATSQSKMDRLYQNKTKLEWKRDAYTDIRTKVSDFSKKYFSSLSPDNIFSKSTYKQFKVSLSDKYNGYFSVKGTSNAVSGNHTITRAKMATAATIRSTKPVTGASGKVGIYGSADNNKSAAVQTSAAIQLADDKEYDGMKLSEMKDSSGNSLFKNAGTAESPKYEFSFKISSAKDESLRSVTLSGNATLKELKGEFAKQGLDVTVGDDGKLTFTSQLTGGNSDVQLGSGFSGLGDVKQLDAQTKIKESTKLSDIAGMAGKGSVFSGGNLSFKINGVTFSTAADTEKGEVQIDKSASMKDLAKTVTDALKEKGAGAELTFSESSGFAIVGEGEVSVENITGKFFGASGMENDSDSVTGIRAQTAKRAATLERTKDTGATAAQKMGLTDVFDENGEMSLKIRNTKGDMVELKFDKSETIDTMLSRINSNTGLGVKASYSQITDRFEFTSTETGLNSKIEIKGGSGNALDFFGISGASTAEGTDAEIEIDGQTIYQSKNTFTLDGMEITLNDNFTAGESKYEGTTLSEAKFGVTQDIDATVDKVKAFVTAFNELVDGLYGTIKEERDYDYDPLTESMREELEDKDIEKWDEAAKKGILRNDTTISSFLSRMRSALFEHIGGVSFGDMTGDDEDGLSPARIGFSTVAYATGEYGGKINFDEEKFRAAMERDSDAVARLMTNVSDATDKTKNYSESGFATKLFDMMGEFTSTLRGTNITNTNNQITSVNKQMDDLLSKMYDEQERLYKQYASLETLMASYQNQSSYLTSFFSSSLGS